MKRSFLVAFALMVGVGGAFANTIAPTVKTADGIYNYYLENNCDVAIVCSEEFDGPACSEILSGQIVYDAPSCISGHETTNILGKYQP